MTGIEAVVVLILGVLIGVLAGGGWKVAALRTAEYLALRMSRENGRLGRRIFRQRVVIRSLKGEVTALRSALDIEGITSKANAAAEKVGLTPRKRPNLPH